MISLGTTVRLTPSTKTHYGTCPQMFPHVVYIWCQHCEHDLCEGIFYIGVVLYKSWQCIVQVGIAAWRQLQKICKKRDLAKQFDMERAFTSIWSHRDLFCYGVGGKPKWNPISNRHLLTRDFANRFYSVKIQRKNVDDGDNHTLVSEQEDCPFENSQRMATPLMLRDKAENLTKTIID